MLLLAGCGGGPGVSAGVGTAPSPRPPPPTTLAAVFVLESVGVPPDDTTLGVPAAEARVIILRRGAPDNSLFAEIAIPERAADPNGRADSMTVRITPRPGLYGLDLTATGPVADTRVTFSYGVHFMPPAGARERYGSDLAFEEALWIAQVDPAGSVVFLPTTRPGSDLLSAVVPGPGRYVVAAPRR